MTRRQEKNTTAGMETVFYHERFTMLLASLLIYMFLAPFLIGLFSLKLLMNIFFSCIFLSAIYAVSKRKSDLIIITLLAVPSVFCLWMAYYDREYEYFLAFSIIGIFFTGYIIIVFLRFIYNEHTVNRNVISAALVVYLFMGILWCSMYTALEMLHPGSFKVQQDWLGQNPTVFIYYSFVTLTTLGFGDITPMTSKAASLSILEAIVGQIYIAVMLARLVGMQTAQFLEKNRTVSGAEPEKDRPNQ